MARAGRRLAPWLVLAVLLSGALVFAGRPHGGPGTVAARVHHLAGLFRCPTCQGLSAAESDAPASRSIRQAIQEQVQDGGSDRQIRDFMVARHGPDILTAPGHSGFDGLVWLLPIAAMLVASAALGAAFWRWSAAPRLAATDDDRRLVDRARTRK